MFVSWWCRNEYFRPLPSSFWVLIFFYFFSLNYCTNGVGFLNATSVYRSIWQLLHLTFSYHLSSISGSWPKSFFCRECKLFFFAKFEFDIFTRCAHMRMVVPNNLLLCTSIEISVDIIKGFSCFLLHST